MTVSSSYRSSQKEQKEKSQDNDDKRNEVEVQMNVDGENGRKSRPDVKMALICLAGTLVCFFLGSFLLFLPLSWFESTPSQNPTRLVHHLILIRNEKSQVNDDQRNNIGVPMNVDDENGSKSTKQVPRGDATLHWRVVPICFAILFLFSFPVISVAIVMGKDFEKSPNPNPTRLVHLHKANGGYGLVLNATTIEDVVTGGAAQRQGEIKRSDEILAINGIDVSSGQNRNGIAQLLELRDNDVKLLVIKKYKAVFSDKVRVSLPISFKICILVAVMGTSIAVLDNTKEKRREMHGREVTLTTTNGYYGMVHKRNEVVEVTPGGPADIQGNIKEGDVIMSVNGVKILGFSTETIQQLFKTRCSDVKLTVGRKTTKS